MVINMNRRDFVVTGLLSTAAFEKIVRSQSMVDLVVRRGHVVTADAEFDADVAVDGGKIAAIGAPASMPQARRTVDAQRKYFCRD